MDVTDVLCFLFGRSQAEAKEKREAMKSSLEFFMPIEMGGKRKGQIWCCWRMKKKSTFLHLRRREVFFCKWVLVRGDD